MQKTNSRFFFCGLFLLSQSVLAQSAMDTHTANSCLLGQVDQAWVEGAEFIMGDDSAYREEGPAHAVAVSGFWMDAHEVTNAQFAEFVEETDYITVAEQSPNPADWPADVPAEFLQPGSVLFVPPLAGQPTDNWWSWVAGTNWRHPDGPDSNITGRVKYPVIHIAFEDADADARWAGR